LLELYGGDNQATSQIISRIKNIKKELMNLQEKSDTPFTPAYAITVHKSQGSDFDYVIFVLSEQSSFITRELLYTGFTRAKKKMYLLVHEKNLKDDLYNLVVKAYRNSSIDQIHTLLFGHKFSPFRPYVVYLKDGNKIAVRSKVEYIIAKTLDNLGIEFEYEPEDFVEYRIKPDFKILSDTGIFYWEHLGLLSSEWYKDRWFKKFEVYKKLGIADVLITTSESEEPYGDIEKEISKIIDDLKKGNLKLTEGSYSRHHYVI